ncbi:MAG: adenosylcobinamide-phosphate synthase CbiB [Thermodesulfobacteriota bacterium]|nr:adenosylcobinamide-phosphate synthase CbiB [Thermodesulfobacteriota bacterium]
MKMTISSLSSLPFSVDNTLHYLSGPIATLLGAFILDLFFGDPPYRFHPIRLIGQGIDCLQKALRTLGLDGRVGGILLVVGIGSVSLGGYLFGTFFLQHIYPPMGRLFDLFVCYSCIALKDLIRHVKPVIRALEDNNLEQAREKLSMVVGREVTLLDEEGVARGAVETLAENFVDGFLSPIFWYVIGCVIGYAFGKSPIVVAVSFMLVFKVVSTLDSMVGYTSSKYILFGRAGAKMDDFMNFIPARLSLFVLFLGACISGLQPVRSLRVALRDRLKHKSPNAAHAQSFVAGALDARLGGPTRYPDGLKRKAWIGNGRPDLDSRDVRKTASLVVGSAFIVMAVITVLEIIFSTSI